MLRGIGPRFYVEAGFLIVVAAVLAVQRVPPLEIVVVMLVAYLAVFSFEVVLARRRAAVARAGQPGPAGEVTDVTPEPAEELPSAIVAVRSAEPDETVVVPVELEADSQATLAEDPPKTEWVDDPPRRPIVASQPISEPEPPVAPLTEAEPEAGPEPKIAPVPEPEPETELEPEPAIAPVVLVAVPAPDPEPDPVATPEPLAESASEPVVIASFPQQPRAWNLWELERLVRSRAGDDPLRDEEWGYLLVYLRDFASPEGVLPEEFDALVRESFGDLLEAAAAR